MIPSGLRRSLYAYLGGILRGEKGTLYAVGGTDDHIHLLFRWRPDESLSTLVRKLKRNSSLWTHNRYPDLRNFYWQEGYGAFSVSRSLLGKTKGYIANQEEHHRRRDFKTEFVALLQARGLTYDAELLWE